MLQIVFFPVQVEYGELVQILYFGKLAKLRNHVDLALSVVQIKKIQAEDRLWAQGPNKVLHPQEVLTSGRITIDGMDLVASLETLGFCIAAGTNTSHVATIANHLHLKAVIVHIGPWRNHEVRVGVMETVKECSDVGKSPVERIRLVNLLFCFTNLCVPINAPWRFGS